MLLFTGSTTRVNIYEVNDLEISNQFPLQRKKNLALIRYSFQKRIYYFDYLSLLTKIILSESNFNHDIFVFFIVDKD